MNVTRSLTSSPTALPVLGTEAPAAAATPVPTTESSIVAMTPAPTLVPTVAAPEAREPGSPGMPPDPVPPREDCDPTADLMFTMDYIESDSKAPYLVVRHVSADPKDHGCVTLTKIWEWLQTEPTDVPMVSVGFVWWESGRGRGNRHGNRCSSVLVIMIVKPCIDLW